MRRRSQKAAEPAMYWGFFEPLGLGTILFWEPGLRSGGIGGAAQVVLGMGLGWLLDGARYRMLAIPSLVFR